MKPRKTFTRSTHILASSVALLISAGALRAVPPSYTTPHIITGDVPNTATLGGTIFINHGLVGVGRVSGSALDAFGNTFGSISGLAITNWASTGGGSYTGIFNTAPDVGYNTPGTVLPPNAFSADLGGSIHRLGFTFTPYLGSANIGGTSIEEKIAAQNQIGITYLGAQRFTYDDPIFGTNRITTGLNPRDGTTTLFGNTMPFTLVDATNGLAGAPAVNRLSLDVEAVVLLPDGSGYVGDEIGANIYRFDANKKIIGAIVPPEAVRPHGPAGTLYFGEPLAGEPAQVNGRRAGQGLEGMGITPDGTKLFALVQSATLQDGPGAQATRYATRLLIYDVTGGATPSAPSKEFVIELPTFRNNGNGQAADRTGQQSEIMVLDDHRFLVLSRDANGLGTNPTAANPVTAPTVFKTILLVDLNVGTPTDIAGDAARNAEGGRVTVGSAGALDPSITPLSYTEAINMLNSTQLAKFNIEIDPGGSAQVNELTLSDKMEGMALVPALDPANPNDFFLFVGNDNNFLTSQGTLPGSDGLPHAYNAFASYAANRIPAPVGSATASEVDTMFLAYRVTIVPEPGSTLLLAGGASLLLGRRRRF